MDIASLFISIDSSDAVVADKRLKQLTSSGKELSDVIGLVTKGFLLFKAGSFLGEVAQLAARYDTLGVVMRVVGNNAGYSMAQMEDYTKVLQKQGISMNESRQTLTRMTQAHLDLAKSSELARMAQNAAVIGDVNSSEAFQRMIYGIQSGQTEVLKTIGINVNFEKSYEKVAVQLHKTSKALTEQEKTTARMNAVLERAGDIAGVYEASLGTVGKAAKSLERIWENLKVVSGMIFQEGFTEVINGVTNAFQTATDWVIRNKDGMMALGSSMADVVRQGASIVSMLADITGGSKSAEKGIGGVAWVFRGVAMSMAIINDIFTMVTVTIQVLIGKTLQGLGALGQYLAHTSIGTGDSSNSDWAKGIGDDMVKSATDRGKAWAELSATGKLQDDWLRQESDRVSKAKDNERKWAEALSGNAASHSTDNKEKERLAASAIARGEMAKADKEAKDKKDMRAERERYTQEYIKLMKGESAAYIYGETVIKGYSDKVAGTLNHLRLRNEYAKENEKLMKAEIDAYKGKYNAMQDELTATKSLELASARRFVARQAEIDMFAAEKKAIAENRKEREKPIDVDMSRSSFAAFQSAMAYADPLASDREKLLQRRQDIELMREQLTAMGLYKTAIENIRLAEMRLRAEAGDTWAIIGQVVVGNAGSATDAVVTWMNSLNGVSRTWKSLGDTVRNVVADMLIQMQKAIMQQKLMQPLMNWASNGSNWASLFGMAAGGGYGGGNTSMNGPNLQPLGGIANKGGGISSGFAQSNTVSITIHSDGSSTTASSGPSALKIGKMIDAKVREVLATESRASGMNSRS